MLNNSQKVERIVFSPSVKHYIEAIHILQASHTSHFNDVALSNGILLHNPNCCCSAFFPHQVVLTKFHFLSGECFIARSHIPASLSRTAVAR